MRKNWFAVVAVLSCAACVDALNPPDPRAFGVFLLTTTESDSAYVLNPEGVFFRASDVSFPNSASPADACTTLPYSTQTAARDLDDVLGGSPVTLTLRSVATNLTPRQEDRDFVYRPTDGAAIAHTPGDSAYLNIPGAAGGFPQTTAAARTAESFTFATVTVPPVGQGLQLTWSAAAQPGSAMAFSLQYARSPSTTLNEQLYCELIDDGSFLVPTLQVDPWRDANNNVRGVSATRFRTLRQPSTNNSVLLVLSRLTVTQQ